ncbi:MAG: ABC transporter permease [Bacteroidales bacterium]
MNFHIIKVIISREYLNRVKKKSFIWITFLGPLFFAAMCILPSVIMVATKEEAKKVGVVDESGIVLPFLTNTETIEFSDCSAEIPDSLKKHLEAKGLDAMLVVSPLDSATKSVELNSYSEKPLGVDMGSTIESKVDNAIEDYRIKSYDITGLGTIMDEVKSDVKLTSYTLDDAGKETLSASEVYMIISMVLAMIIYMFIAMFCGTVMSSVIEEKSSRVVEVLVSSVKSTELLFGKIIGVALVALTQFILWIVLTVLIVSVVGSVWGFDKIASSATDPTTQMTQSMGVDQNQLDAMGVSTMDMSAITASVADSSVTQGPVNQFDAILTTLKGINYTQMLVVFLLYFIFGYLLYASLFAAIGSAVENEADSQQLTIPVTVPLLIGFFIAFYTFKSPDSGIAFWGSMIPFTSPIVMLARLPFGVPVWQLVLSIALLIVTFVGCAWVSAKIYKVGILMFGKKSSFKDMWKWLKQ